MSWKRTSLWMSEANERAWMLSDNISGSNRVNERSKWGRWGLLVLSAISYFIGNARCRIFPRCAWQIKVDAVRLKKLQLHALPKLRQHNHNRLQWHFTIEKTKATDDDTTKIEFYKHKRAFWQTEIMVFITMLREM